MDYDFQVDFVTVFGFNYDKAAEFFEVHRRTILRWYHGTPPRLVKRFMSVMARGYLPEYAPFNDWKIVGADIYTPNGKVSAVDVEYARAYKNNARMLEARFKNRSLNTTAMMKSIETILNESDRLSTYLTRAI